MSTVLQRGKAQTINFGKTAENTLDQNGRIRFEAQGRMVRVDVDFVGVGNQTFKFDGNDYGIVNIKTLFIDNSNSAAATTIVIGGSNQKMVAPPYTQGYYPILLANDFVEIFAQSAGNVVVPITFINYFIDLMIWSIQGQGAIIGTVNVAGSVTVLPLAVVATDRSIALAAAGVSQIIMAANGARKRLFIQNPTDEIGQNIVAREPVYLRFGAAANVNDGISIELQPGQSYDSGMGPVSTQAIYINAATINHRVSAHELQ